MSAMLRQAAMLSRSVSRAALRSFATHPAQLTAAAPSLLNATRAFTATTQITYSKSIAAATVAAAGGGGGMVPLPTALKAVSAFTAASWTPRRWNSTMSSAASSSSAPATNADAAAAQADSALPPANLPVEESPSTTPSVAEQMRGLSAEDQERIIAALQQPEKEKSSVMGGAGIGPADGDMVAAFTCGPCDYRMVKRFSKHAYTKGIVIVECPNCRAKHLLADNLGWLEDEARNIEDILREKGESFTRIGGTTGDFQVMGSGHEDTAPASAASADAPKAQG